MGVSTAVALAEVEKIERVMERLSDIPAIYDEWRRLIVQYNIQGVKVHDARLVAAMNMHNVPRILTFNAGDFARYGVEVLRPASALS